MEGREGKRREGNRRKVTLICLEGKEKKMKEDKAFPSNLLTLERLIA